MSNNTKSNALWGGRFNSGVNDTMQALNASIKFDQRLAQQDILGSLAHVSMLSKQGIIAKEEANKIISGLDLVKQEIESGLFNFSEAHEDIHMNIENRLFELIGSTAGVLHTGRSRNDQVATDFRLWVRDATDEIVILIADLMKSFLHQAENGIDTIMPGFTHLQLAQPVTFGHHMLAYVEMLSRDKKRFIDSRLRLNECPLGAAALAGTSFPIDRELTAKALSFDRPMANSIDAVSDRDFALEFLSCCSLCATHLSRFSEEIVIWSSSQFNFVTLSDSFSTGSSIMPQKRNPDAAELIRAKVGRVNGSLTALLTVMKGLPLAYSKDLQEDKEQVFDTKDTMCLMLKVMKEMVADLKPNKAVLLASSDKDFSTATDLADWLVKKLKIPFRDAHRITGNLVRVAEQQGCNLCGLDLDVFKSFDERITREVYKVLNVVKSVESRQSYGGTSPCEVKKQVDEWKKVLN